MFLGIVMPRKLERFLFTLTPALRKAIDQAKGDHERNSWIENMLWGLPVIQNTGVSRELRNPDGVHPTEECDDR